MREIFSNLADNKIDPQSDHGKQYIVDQVAGFVYDKMPYDYDQKIAYRAQGRSMNLEDVMKDHMSVCRHHALFTQVILQSFGITSRLLKCTMRTPGTSDIPHAANLVRINSIWHLVDTTNPDRESTGKITPFVKPLMEREVNTGKNNYEWNITAKLFGAISPRTYRSRDNMYYRIMDNNKK